MGKGFRSVAIEVLTRAGWSFGAALVAAIVTHMLTGDPLADVVVAFLAWLTSFAFFVWQLL